MRLLAATSLDFKEFVRESSTPKYAILSRNWGAEEVTYEHMLTDMAVA